MIAVNWLTDDLIFWGGIALAAVVLVVGIVWLLLLWRQKKKIFSAMNQEYGPPID